MSVQNSSRLLADQPFIAVQPDVIRNLSGNAVAAIVLQHLNYRLTGRDSYEDEQGRIWYQVKHSDLADETGLSRDQVKHAMTKLREVGVVLVSQLNGYDRTNFYAIDHAHPVINEVDPSGKSAPSMGDIRPLEEANPPLVLLTKTYKDSQDLTPADASDAVSVVVDEPAHAGHVVGAYVDHHAQVHGEAPPSRHKGRIARDARQLIEEGKNVATLVEAAQKCAEEGHANLASAYTWTLAQDQRQASRQQETRKESGAAAYFRLAQQLEEQEPNHLELEP